jgi:hypothetical protein
LNSLEGGELKTNQPNNQTQKKKYTQLRRINIYGQQQEEFIC